MSISNCDYPQLESLHASKLFYCRELSTIQYHFQFCKYLHAKPNTAILNKRLLTFGGDPDSRTRSAL